MDSGLDEGKDSDEDLHKKYGISHIKVMEMDLNPLKPRVGIICTKKFPTWSIAVGDLCGLSWLCTSGSRLHSLSKHFIINDLSDSNLKSLFKVFP